MTKILFTIVSGLSASDTPARVTDVYGELELGQRAADAKLVASAIARKNRWKLYSLVADGLNSGRRQYRAAFTTGKHNAVAAQVVFTIEA